VVTVFLPTLSKDPLAKFLLPLQGGDVQPLDRKTIIL
jgi:hypothetical protein